MGPDFIQSFVDILVATVYLVYIVYAACAAGAHGGYEHGYAGAYVGRHHVGGTQRVQTPRAYDGRAVWIAQYYLCAHVDKFVDEKQAALKHLLVYEHASAGLSGYYKKNTQQVG